MMRRGSFPIVAIFVVTFLAVGFVGQDRKVSKPKTSVEDRIRALETEIAELKSMLSEGSRNLQVAKKEDVNPVKGGREPFLGSRDWTEGTRGWDEDGTNIWTSVAPLPLYSVGIGTATPNASYKLDIDGSGVNGRGLIVKGYNFGISVSVNTPTPSTSVAISAYNSSTVPGQPIGVKGEAWNVGVETNGIGGKFEGGKYGVYGMVTPTGSNDYYGVLGTITGGSGINYGVKGSAANGVTNYGVHGSASGGTNNYAGYFSGNLNIQNGKILINESAPANKCLTTDASGDPQWSDTPSDGDWTVNGSDMYSAVSGNVGIGDATPTDAKLCVYHETDAGIARGIYSMGKVAAGNNNIAYGGRFEGDADLSAGANANAYGVYSIAKCKVGKKCYGGYFYAGQGFMGPICTEYGIYAEAANPDRDDAYAGYFKGKSYFDGSSASYAGYFNGEVDVAQNMRIKLGNAYISSGGNNYAFLASNAWFDGTNWQIPDGARKSGLIMCDDEKFSFYSSQTAGADDWTPRLEIDASGRVGIARTPTTNTFEVNGNASKTAAGDWLANSDKRLKKNIQPLKDALKKILALQPRYFEWKEMEDIYGETLSESKRREIESGSFPKGRQMGFIAQECIDIIPSLVAKQNDGYYMMQYGSMDPLFVEAIKEQQKEIETLRDEVRILKEETEDLSILKSELEELKTHVAQIEDASPWRLARE